MGGVFHVMSSLLDMHSQPYLFQPMFIVGDEAGSSFVSFLVIRISQGYKRWHNVFCEGLKDA